MILGLPRWRKRTNETVFLARGRLRLSALLAQFRRPDVRTDESFFEATLMFVSKGRFALQVVMLREGQSAWDRAPVNLSGTEDDVYHSSRQSLKTMIMKTKIDKETMYGCEVESNSQHHTVPRLTVRPQTFSGYELAVAPFIRTENFPF